MRNKDFAEKQTDKMIDELEEKIAKIYAQAQKELEKKYLKYSKAFQIEDEKRRKELQENYTDENVEKYNNWRKNKFFTEKRYKEMFEVLSEDLAKVDQKAMSIANGFLPEAYALNFNYETYDMEQNTQLNTSFTLYSRETVERLEKGGRKLLPKRKVDIPKDKVWNLKHLRNEITQGVLQGKSIPDIAKSLQKVTDMDRRAAVRNARTMMTGAQNGGRLDAMNRAKGFGIRIQKEWMATLDSRTRDSHAELDGKRVALDSYFPNGCQCPGDPNGAPEEVYNCRCTMVAFYPDYQDIMQKRITYKEWAEQRAEQAENKPENVLNIDHTQWLWNVYNNNYTMQDVDELNQLYQNAPEELQRFYEKYGSQLTEMKDISGSGYFSSGDGKVHFNSKEDQKGTDVQNRFGLSSHEIGHNMDWLANEKKTNFYLSQIYRDKNGMSFKDIIYKDWEDYFLKKASEYNKESAKAFSDYESIFTKIAGRSPKKGRNFMKELIDKARVEDKDSTLSNKINDIEIELDRLRWKGAKLKEYKEFYFDNKDFFEKYSPKRWVTIDYELLDDFCTEIKSNYNLIERGDLSDMFERFSIEHGGSDYPLGVGHGTDYALLNGRLERETFAEMTSSTLTNDVSLDLIKTYLPNAYEAYLDMLKGAIK